MTRDSAQGCTSGGSGIDVAAVHAVADRIGAAAELIDDAVGHHLMRLAFDGGRAGRAHRAHGEALRAGLDRLAAESVQWSKAAIEIAAALHSGADRYADADRHAASRIA